MSETDATHGIQYAGIGHETRTAVAGMWLFLATELLFFGALLLAWIWCRHWTMAGFDAGSHATTLWIGTVNTALLVTSSFLYARGTARFDRGDVRGLVRLVLPTLLLGCVFLGLKGYEWADDFQRGLWPGADFAITGADAGGAKLFFSFYFVATALHALHMGAGLGLLAMVLLRARSAAGFMGSRAAMVEVVGLYWSFVDLVWLMLYPMIYLIGRSG